MQRAFRLIIGLVITLIFSGSTYANSHSKRTVRKQFYSSGLLSHPAEITHAFVWTTVHSTVSKIRDLAVSNNDSLQDSKRPFQGEISRYTIGGFFFSTALLLIFPFHHFW
jgi:hypothetical protein